DVRRGICSPQPRAGHRATAAFCRGGESDGASRQQPLTLTFAIRLYTNPPEGSAELGGSAALAE
ncbi:hypothetical protein, partial [Pantoea ananatis]|uniref:hypothetical protein n=1 Tax=Pantoea ananas TaxID=553 RepID=UPI0023D7FC1C